MALLTKEIVDDTGSDKVEQLRLMFNALLNAIDTSSDYATLVANMQADCSQILLNKTPPARPFAPLTPVK